MQPIRRLMQNLDVLANSEHCLFTPSDLRALLPELSETAFKTLLMDDLCVQIEKALSGKTSSSKFQM